MKSIKSIGHVAVRVKDIEKSLDFYVRKLGFREMFRLDRDNKLWIVYLRVTDDQFIELFPEAIGDRSPPAEAIGLNHICLTVDDMDDALADLAKHNIPLYRPKKMQVDRNWQAWIEDPDGNRIELMQMADDGMQAEAIRKMRAMA
jgi:lactoylglutathione lyase